MIQTSFFGWPSDWGMTFEMNDASSRSQLDHPSRLQVLHQRRSFIPTAVEDSLLRQGARYIVTGRSQFVDGG